MTRTPKSTGNTTAFSLLCLVLGFVNGWILAITALVGAIVLVWPASWLICLAFQLFGKLVELSQVVNMVYAFLLFVLAPVINYAWLRIISWYADNSKTAAWSLALGAAISYFEFGKRWLLISESDTVKMTWAPAIATGIIGLAVGAYLVSRVEKQKRRNAD